MTIKKVEEVFRTIVGTNFFQPLSKNEKGLYNMRFISLISNVNGIAPMNPAKFREVVSISLPLIPDQPYILKSL